MIAVLLAVVALACALVAWLLHPPPTGRTVNQGRWRRPVEFYDQGDES